MWIAHYVSGLVAKPFAPLVPLSVLCLAGALPDALFFLLQFVGIESFNLNPALIPRGCFPYSNDYPYSHSLAGMVASGVALAVGFKMCSSAPVGPKEQAAIVLASASHFLFEWPSHREDVKITPHDAQQLGAGLFDHPAATFAVESALFLGALWVYATLAPLATRAGYTAHPRRLHAVVALMLAQQAHFCFGSAPTTQTRWVHAPVFLFEILASCWLIGRLEG
ncbi:hypothetical protein B0H21DRAFT_777358 [Amylocystis lapponica]|nr:hypothetical protein B0H21DRAFT_777358 [Amylocystis lapponica]